MYRTLITVEQLETLAEPLIFDCRFNLADTGAGERAYREGHIPGAIYLNLDHDLSSPITPESGRHPLPDAAQLASRLAAVGLTPSRQVVVYDDAGGAVAARAWWLLRWLGHEAVAVLDGGWPAWCEQHSPATHNPRLLPGADIPLTAEPDAERFIDVGALQLSLKLGQIVLFDARAAERFNGEMEPIDPVAGHVPGAINAPLSGNLDQSGRFHPSTVLRKRWLELLGDQDPRAAVHMCGSGVTACHNLLAMEHAGLSGARLYPGSWSEWIRDPARPIA
ncbi:sulfurtransferase [Marinobacterium litorale]|uniref:sulfurtransferase n=1 Tax=Marinobacterium litorale TaxID=404770 RepID=UPI00040CD12B|nr:sulfurtransferase [Marinobacterium litorale]